MANQTPIYGFPIFEPAVTDFAELGINYFNSLTGDSPVGLTNKLETILSTLNENKPEIHAKSEVEWAADITTILRSGEWGLDTTRGILRLGDGDNTWNDLQDYLPALPVLSGNDEPTATTSGLLGQFYLHDGATPRLFICVKADAPYLWISLSYSDDFDDFRSIYDSDESGIVDNSEKLGGQSPSYYLNTDQKGAANGVATLGSDSKVPASQLDFTEINTAISDVRIKVDDVQDISNVIRGDLDGLSQSHVILSGTVSDVQQGVIDLETAVSEAQSDIESNKQSAETANINAAKKITGGYEISIASSAWTASGNTWVATIADARIPAETDEYRIAPHINWDEATLANIAALTAWISVKSPVSGGSYIATVGHTADEAPEKPTFTMVGDVEILEVKRI